MKHRSQTERSPELPSFERLAYALCSQRDHEHAEESRAALAAEATEGGADRFVAAAEAALRESWRLLDGVEAA